MATKLVSLRFDQAANLVDDPANQHAKITLFKRRAPVKKAVLSDNERRARVQAAAQEQWGDAANQKWVYVQDMVGDVAIIANDGKLFGVQFVIDDKGTVGFSGEPAPVATSYEVLKNQPSVGSVHVDSPDWLKKDNEYLANKRRSWK